MNRGLKLVATGMLFLATWGSALVMAQAAEQKTIKDPTEYNAYITALNTADPAAKAAAMEAFVAQYPNSVVKVDALEQAMAAYQQAQNTAKVAETAKRLIALDPNRIRALAIVTAIDRNLATSGNAAAQKEGCGYAKAGLEKLPTWTKPEAMPDADFEKVKEQMAGIFAGALGFCALQAKDFAGAREAYLKAVQSDPTNVQDVYQLTVADLEMSPMDLSGLWYCGKAINLAKAQNNAAAANGITPYCKSKYKRYHGGDDGWDQIVASAATGAAPPANFAGMIKPAPTPCDIAVDAATQNDPKDLSFSDKEFILSKADCSPANKAAADKVWQSIQEMEKNGAARLEIPVKVVSATKDSLEVAVSDDNQQASKVDMHVALEKPVLHPPAAGSMTKVVGVITDYKPDPFMFVMSQGALPAGH